MRNERFKHWFETYRITRKPSYSSRHSKIMYNLRAVQTKSESSPFNNSYINKAFERKIVIELKIICIFFFLFFHSAYTGSLDLSFCYFLYSYIIRLKLSYFFNFFFLCIIFGVVGV